MKNGTMTRNITRVAMKIVSVCAIVFFTIELFKK